MELRLRQAVPADAGRIAAVHQQCWRETYTLPAEAWETITEQSRRTMWEQLLGEPGRDRKVTLALADGTLIGVAWARTAMDPGAVRDLELYGLYVLTAWHGTGIGQALLDDVIGVEPAWLWVAVDNLRAQAFYRRNGFRVDEGREQLTAAAEAIIPVLRMIR